MASPSGTCGHMNSSMEKIKGIKLKISENDVLNHLEFLKDVEDKYQVTEGPVLKRAIERYERYWLPLAAKNDKTIMAAPLDIAWVWHCHMLCPTAYFRDCMNVVGKVVPHKLMEKGKRVNRMAKDEVLWKKEYGVTFDYNMSVNIRDPEDSFVSKIRYNLEEASARQRLFYYNVSLPHYRDNKFLETSLDRYRKFLYLLQKNPNMFLVPTYDIDLIWHTHQLNPTRYEFDMMRIVGKHLNHDDTATDRRKGSKLNNGEKLTRRIWNREFNESFARPGAMHRGDSPRQQLTEESMESIEFRHPIKSVCVQITEVQLDRLPKKARKATLEINNFEKDFTGQGNRAQKYLQSKEWVNYKQMLWKGSSLFCCRVNADDDAQLNFNLKGKSGYFFLKKQRELGEGSLNILDVIEKMEGDTHTFSEDIQLKDSPIIIKIKGTLSDPRRSNVKLSLREGAFESIDSNEEMREIWGPVPLRPNVPGLGGTLMRKTCVATHQLVNNNDVAFTCKVMHSTASNMSAALVYHGDKLVSYAHLVGSDQLPASQSVEESTVYSSEDAISLDPQKGERAMIIKNTKGDWGVIVGNWTGMKQGVPAIKGTKDQKGTDGIPGSYGYLGLNFLNLADTKMSRGSSLPGIVYNIGLGDIICHPGSIELRKGAYEAAENVALAFSVSILHVLCQPRSAAWRPGMSPNIYRTASFGVNLPLAEEVTFLSAAGILSRNPCNRFLVEQQKHQKISHSLPRNTHPGNEKADADANIEGGDSGFIEGPSIEGESNGIEKDFCGEVPMDVELHICDTGDIGGSVCGAGDGGSGCGAGCGGGDGGLSEGDGGLSGGGVGGGGDSSDGDGGSPVGVGGSSGDVGGSSCEGDASSCSVSSYAEPSYLHPYEICRLENLEE